ncbi:GNAT family N-acetyltransferase [Bosea vaviloviae]|uniref:GNAT family N-acetyltransferase n=2 Tax=Bosea vaviloviae TaxID=1526658 RepID=A0A1D7U175_9HYPH|nr:GNAT family N-acetyltransferase [Bosea vaviloviae]
MTAADLPCVLAVAAQAHPGYPEDEAVFTERLALSAQGCLCLEETGLEESGRVGGYVVSHPWLLGQVPALNSQLGALPDSADTYYIHDLALLPQLRGSGAANEVVAQLVRLARGAGFASLALAAVNGSAGFWRRHGFRETHDASLDRKLASYDDAARYMVRDLATDEGKPE